MSRLDPPIRAMFDATNAEDFTAFVDSFAQDAILVDWGPDVHGPRRDRDLERQREHRRAQPDWG